MKNLISMFLVLFSFSVSAQANTVAEGDLRDLLRQCRDDQNEARCLRRGIRDLIGDREEHNPLICRGNGNAFAIYNQDTGNFVDGHYAKTAEECQKAIQNSKNDLVCASQNSKAAIRNLVTLEFVDQYYDKTLDDCMTTISQMRKNIVCVSSKGKYARYNIERKEFLDTQYSLTLQQCIQLIP